MTPQTIRRMSPSELRVLFTNRQATVLPVGEFDGQAWSDDLPGLSTLFRLWQGKLFYPKVIERATVSNRILGHLLVHGEASLADGSVWIDYPQLGLRDELRPIEAGLWLGRMQLGPSVIWFTLEAET